jgi:hypothetical protein
MASFRLRVRIGGPSPWFRSECPIVGYRGGPGVGPPPLDAASRLPVLWRERSWHVFLNPTLLIRPITSGRSLVHMCNYHARS